MKNDAGRVIYVGKAKSLRRRVSQYFLPGRDVKTRALVSHIDSIGYIMTGTEYEALILENNLIKKYQPRYNIDLKDGKTYQMIKITREDFPRVLRTRKRLDDGAGYYGPFPKGRELELYFRMLENNFSFRRCRNALPKRQTPCLYYHINKCSAPCCGKADREQYRTDISRIERMLEGDIGSAEEMIEKRMRNAADELDFEKAAEEKETLAALRKISSSQTVGNLGRDTDKDYIASFCRDSHISVQMMQYRVGNLVGSACYHTETLADEKETVESFLMQYYENADELPAAICISFEINDALLGECFTKRFGRSPLLEHPSDGRDFRILQLARINAVNDLEKLLSAEDAGVPENDRLPPDRPCDTDGQDEALTLSDKTPEYALSFSKILESLPRVGKATAGKITSVFGCIEDFLSFDDETIAAKCRIPASTVRLIRSRLSV